MAHRTSMALTTAPVPADRTRRFEIQITLLADGSQRDPVIAVEVHRRGLLRHLNRQVFGKPRRLSS